MRLVICDDHRLLLDTLGGALSARGYQVDALVTTAAEVVEAARTHDPDIAIVDVHLAVGDGLEATAEIARSCPRTKVLLMSSMAEAAVVRQGLEAGAAGFVRKDQSVEAIVSRIEQVAAGEGAFDLAALRAVVRQPRESPSDPRQLLRRLSERERQVLALLVEGYDTAAMAKALNIADSTARTHVQNVLAKLGVHSRLQVSAMAARTGLAELLGRSPARPV